MQRKRFQFIIAEVKGPNAGFGVSPTHEQLVTVAGRLVDADLDDIRATLADLAAEFDTVPERDGDTQDDIFRAKTTLEKLLRIAEGEKPDR